MTGDAERPAPPYRPEPRPQATGTDEGRTELAPDEEPTTTGTLFIMILFLMAIAGFWGIMYFTLLNR